MTQTHITSQNILENREEIEGRFVFGLWKEPTLYSDYERDIAPDVDLITDDGNFYYSLGLALYQKGLTKFDDVSIDAYLQEHPKIQEKFYAKGGYSVISDARAIINAENIDTYYDDLIKNNALIQLLKGGYNMDGVYEKSKKMTYDQLQDYMEFNLNNVFLKASSNGVKAVSLSKGYKSYIEKWNRGEGEGFPIGFHMMHHHLAGIHKGNLTLHLGHIGNGKSTSALAMYVLPAIERGIDVCIIGNEQDEEEFRQMILSTVMFTKIKAKSGMNRQGFLFGKFSDLSLKAMDLAEAWLENQQGEILFVHLTDYKTSTVKRIMKKYAKLGIEYFLFDTLKPENESSEQAWAEFSETAKALFQIAHKEKVAVVATAQLSSESNKRKFLDLSCIGKSRAIAETAGAVIMFRTLHEKEKEKLKVYTFIKGTGTKQFHELTPMQDYIVLFMPKNRKGSSKTQIVFKRNMEFNSYEEIGYCHIEYDGF